MLQSDSSFMITKRDKENGIYLNDKDGGVTGWVQDDVIKKLVEEGEINIKDICTDIRKEACRRTSNEKKLTCQKKIMLPAGLHLFHSSI